MNINSTLTVKPKGACMHEHAQSLLFLSSVATFNRQLAAAVGRGDHDKFVRTYNECSTELDQWIMIDA